MTNNNRLLEVLAPLTAQCADHLRIRTAIIDGAHDRACSLIVGRMIDALQGLLEGDIIEDEGILNALATIDSLPGPVGLMAMHLSAATYIDTYTR
jgi:hypothetical protein